MKILKTIHELPFKFLIVILTSVFLAEIFKRLAVELFISPLPRWALYLIDSAMVATIIFPTLYFFSFRPLRRSLGQNLNAEEVLLQRTLELERANQELTEARKTLELKVRKLEKVGSELNESQKITLSLLEDTNESRDQLSVARQELLRLNQTLEEKVEERTKKLSEAHESLLKAKKLSAIGQLASAIAHEIRNPLTGLTNTAYFLNLCDPSKDWEEMKKHTALINKEVALINQIASNLLDFARLKRPEKQPTDIPKLIQEVIGEFPPPANIHLSVDIPWEIPVIPVDKFQIAQILGNLITNAYQAMPKGGELKISAHNGKEVLEIVCADTGGGIGSENLTKIFEPLFTTKPKGTGLGLAICKQLVEGQGGKLEVESKLGKGSKFVVKLPMTV